jgi:hypothetical protein
MSSKTTVTNYLGVFQQRLDMQLARLKELLKTPKRHRDKHKIKHVLREAKFLKRLLREHKPKNLCPHCNKEITTP